MGGETFFLSNFLLVVNLVNYVQIRMHGEVKSGVMFSV